MMLASSAASGGGGYSGPGDVVTTNWIAFNGLRAFSSATRGQKLANVCDAADAHCADMLSDATTGNAVVPSSNPNCSSSGNCTVKTLYDQSGSLACASTACDLTQATIANRPTLTIGCTGGKVCLTFTATQSLSSGSVSPFASQPFSGSLVGERTGNFTTQMIFTGAVGGDVQVAFLSSANTGYVYAGTVASTTVSDSAFHSIQGVFNNASSVLDVDGSSSAVSSGVNNFTTGICMSNSCAGGFGITGNIAEVAWWAADKSASFAAMNTNQHTYWGF